MGEGTAKLALSYMAEGSLNWYNLLAEHFETSKDLNLRPSKPAIILGIYPTDILRYVQNDLQNTHCSIFFGGCAEDWKQEFPLWHNRIGGISGASGRRFDPWPGTVG